VLNTEPKIAKHIPIENALIPIFVLGGKIGVTGLQQHFVFATLCL